jgi:hypothetical protein
MAAAFDAGALGPLAPELGLLVHSTRDSLQVLFSNAHHTHSKLLAELAEPTPPAKAVHRLIGFGKHNFDFAGAETAAGEHSSSLLCSAPSASASVQPALLLRSLFPPTQGIAIVHEYLLSMSKKSKRLPKGQPGMSGGGDIIDSLVSSIDEIGSNQMRGLPSLSNGHFRQRSDSSTISVSPAPVIQTSKSSTRSPSGNKLSRRSSARHSSKDANGRLRSSNSHEHWLPPIEQEDDFFSVHSNRISNSSNHSNHFIPVPSRSTSITHDVHPPQRSNSLFASAPQISSRSSNRRSGYDSDIPSYIGRYMRERNDSSENLAHDVPRSPMRASHASRNLPSKSRNSTTAIPADGQLQHFHLLTKRQSSQGFERDLSATRHYYSIPSPGIKGPRRSASLNPSRSSITSDNNSLSRVNSNYVQEVLSNPKLTQRIRLTSGRILSFSEVCDLSDIVLP